MAKSIDDEVNENLGELLARLVPNANFVVLAYKNNEVVWQDARPQPSRDDLKEELKKLKKDRKDRRDKEDLGVDKRRFLKSLEGKDLSAAEIKQAVEALLLVV